MSFHDAGGETLGKRGHSEDFRPDLAQMILALVVDAEGRPICTEMVPGNTADVTVLLPVVDRLRTRFGVTRACVVADCGMISADTIAALEKLGMEYILGARERSSSVIHNVVLNDTAPIIPLVLERQRGETQLWVKEVKVGKDRYIVSRNDAEARRTRPTARRSSPASRHSSRRVTSHWSATRPTGVTSRPAARTSRSMSAILPRTRYDGITVARTNAKVTPLQAVLQYRDLLEVESLFRAAKATFNTWPIFHQSDAAIRGHVFCSFLALVLSKELRRLSRAKGLTPEWQPLLRDLDRLREATIEKDGRYKAWDDRKVKFDSLSSEPRWLPYRAGFPSLG
ncbi:transposase [Mesorhizobium sp.]|uniref:IS1634 family transposase n=1 Tax=Mesorhizobium sp. TaxID=1871066 RepID=UPI000FEA38A5|nr:transposase [Mesorhizobium sp.]RWO22176.1 MAG: transposase [Mesorhizobium sp.]